MPRSAGNSASFKKKRKKVAKRRRIPQSHVKVCLVTGRLPTRLTTRISTLASHGAKVRARIGESPENLLKRFKKDVRSSKHKPRR